MPARWRGRAQSDDKHNWNLLERALRASSVSTHSEFRFSYDCELQAESKAGKLVPTVGRSLPTIGAFLEPGIAEQRRYLLICQRLVFVRNDGMSDARCDG